MKRLFTVFSIVLGSVMAYGQTMVYNRAYTAKPGSIGFNSSQYESWEYQRDFGNWKISKLPFRFLKPKNYNPNSATPYPIIVMLHGRGEAGYIGANNDDNEMQLKWGGKQHLDAVNNGTFPGFVLFPQEPWGAWSTGAPDDTSASNQLQEPYLGMMWELVQYLCANYRIDPNRVAVHGLSSGGTGSLASIYHRPDLFAAALPMSAAPTNRDLGNPVIIQNMRRNMGILAPVPVWWFQGDIDDNPAQFVTDQAIGYLRDSGATNPNLSPYTIYKNTAHTTWLKAYAEPNFFPFILAQNKKKIYVMGNNPICCGVGTDLAFSKGFYDYQWYKDGVAIPGATKHKLRNITAGGTYHVTCFRRDKVTVMTSDPVTLTGGLSNTPPTVSLSSPSNGANYIAPATISLGATASDPGGSVAKVDFYQGTTLLFSDVTAPYSYNWTGVVAGNYSITAVATDNLGSSTTSAAIAVTVASNALPIVSITSPANNSSFISPATISLAASASDADGTIAKVDFYQGAVLLHSDATSPYSYSWTGVANGTYSLTAVATDNLGATKTSTVIAVTVSDNAQPSVSLTSPVSGLSFTSPASISLAASASDADGTIMKVDFYQGAVLLYSDASSPYSYDWTGVANGTYSLTAVATDNLGATTTSPAVLVTVTSPDEPTGTGLTAQFFNNTTLTGSPVLTRVDPTVEFVWAGSPVAGVNTNNFGVRWTGKVQSSTSEVYTFYVKSDDGERLYINGSLVTNDYVAHASREMSGTVALVAGQQYDIVLEFFDACCAADVKLSWSSASVAKQTIPQANLFPVASTREEEYESYIESFAYESTKAFPQPTSDVLNVSYASPSGSHVEITMLDNLSQVKMTESRVAQRGNNIFSYDVSDLAPGIYMVTIRSDEKMETIKVVVE